MKLLLKLIVVVVVINAAYHIGMAEYRFSQMKDAAHSMLVLGTHTPIEQLKDQMLQKAADLKLSVPPDNVTLSREGVTTTVNVSYRDDVEPFPGYKYSKDYSFKDQIAAIR
jgi:hypothetical protein